MYKLYIYNVMNLHNYNLQLFFVNIVRHFLDTYIRIHN